MPAYFIACYPRPSDGKYKFDLDYYLKTHMPMQLKLHKPYGMRSYHVIKCTEDSPYVVQTIEYWDSLKKMEKALEETAHDEVLKALYDDIPKYTDIKNPFPIKGEIQGSYVDSELTVEEWTSTGRGF